MMSKTQGKGRSGRLRLFITGTGTSSKNRSGSATAKKKSAEKLLRKSTRKAPERNQPSQACYWAVSSDLGRFGCYWLPFWRGTAACKTLLLASLRADVALGHSSPGAMHKGAQLAWGEGGLQIMVRASDARRDGRQNDTMLQFHDCENMRVLRDSLSSSWGKKGACNKPQREAGAKGGCVCAGRYGWAGQRAEQNEQKERDAEPAGKKRTLQRERARPTNDVMRFPTTQHKRNTNVRAATALHRSFQFSTVSTVIHARQRKARWMDWTSLLSFSLASICCDFRCVPSFSRRTVGMSWPNNTPSLHTLSRRRWPRRKITPSFSRRVVPSVPCLFYVLFLPLYSSGLPLECHDKFSGARLRPCSIAPSLPGDLLAITLSGSACRRSIPSPSTSFLPHRSASN